MDNNPNFWDELFLLKINSVFLERCILLTSEEQFLALKDSLNLIFVHSSIILKESNLVRNQNILQVKKKILFSFF